MIEDCMHADQNRRPGFPVINNRLAKLNKDEDVCHVDLQVARANLNYENATVVAAIANGRQS